MFVLLIDHTFKIIDVCLANIQVHGIQTHWLVLLHVNKINIGTITSINAHGVQTALQYGMETNVFNAQLEPFISKIVMSVWPVLQVHTLIEPFSDVSVQLMLLMFTTTLVFNADIQAIGIQTLKNVIRVPHLWFITFFQKDVIVLMTDQI